MTKNRDKNFSTCCMPMIRCASQSWILGGSNAHSTVSFGQFLEKLWHFDYVQSLCVSGQFTRVLKDQKSDYLTTFIQYYKDPKIKIFLLYNFESRISFQRNVQWIWLAVCLKAHYSALQMHCQPYSLNISLKTYSTFKLYNKNIFIFGSL